MSDDIPEGYTYEPAPSPFVNYVGKAFRKVVMRADGTVETWYAMRVEQHHVNTWGLAHGGFMAFLAEMGTGGGYDPDGPPIVVIDLQTHFMKAPKLGQLVEVCGVVIRRTRSLVFAASRATADGDLLFSSTAIHKVVGA